MNVGGEIPYRRRKRPDATGSLLLDQHRRIALEEAEQENAGQEAARARRPVRKGKH